MNATMTEEYASSENPQPGFSDPLDTLYNSLFHPVATFKTLTETDTLPNRVYFHALCAVVLISALAPAVQLANRGGDAVGLSWAIPLSALTGVFTWAFTGLCTGLLAFAFTGKARIGQFLTLSGLATLPWLLLGPVSLIKFGLGPVGNALAIVATLAIWLWSVYLFGMALMVTYRMTIERALIVLATPFATQLFLLGWILGFVDNIRLLSPT
ncbi:Yip1 family protein [Vampirovibrio chlorellavorus]|uniref:Yip1 family protein n=1 Tax=Vampirovibrio chlorellavorus TaxID=758823 RepID=UPI0026F11918|nr:Yip1 family protein [Vampirovibrio chlorellavorus]